MQHTELPPANFSEANLLNEEDYKCFFEAIRSSPWKLQDRQEIIDEFVDGKKQPEPVTAFQITDEAKQPEAKVKAIRIKRQVSREATSNITNGSVNGSSQQEHKVQLRATKIRESPFISSKRLIKIVSNHLTKAKQPDADTKLSQANHHHRRVSANSNHLSTEDMRGRSVVRSEVKSDKRPVKITQLTDAAPAQRPINQPSLLRDRQSEEADAEDVASEARESAAPMPRRCRRGQSLYIERDAKSIAVNDIVQEMMEGEEASPVKQTELLEADLDAIHPTHPTLQTQVDHLKHRSDTNNKSKTRTTDNFYKKIKASSRDNSRIDSLRIKHKTNDLHIEAFSINEPLLPTEPLLLHEQDRTRSISGTRKMLQKGVFTVIQQVNCIKKMKASVRDRHLPDRFDESVPVNSIVMPLAKINLNENIQHLPPVKFDQQSDHLEDLSKADRSAPPSTRQLSLTAAQRAENIVRLNGYQIVFNKAVSSTRSSNRNFPKPPVSRTDQINSQQQPLQSKPPIASTPAHLPLSVNSSVTKADHRDKSLPKQTAAHKMQTLPSTGYRSSFTLNIETNLGKSISPMLGKIKLSTLLKKVPSSLNPNKEATEPPHEPPATEPKGNPGPSTTSNPLSSLNLNNKNSQTSEKKRFDTLIKSFHKTAETGRRNISTDKENSQRLATLEALKNLIPKPHSQK